MRRRPGGAIRRFVGPVLVAVWLAGCASSSPPPPSVATYPTKGQSPDQQARDSVEGKGYSINCWKSVAALVQDSSPEAWVEGGHRHSALGRHRSHLPSS
jgi:hypothetical protein